MTRRIRFEPEARDELRAAARWYEAQRSGLGLDFIAAVDEAVSRMADLGPHCRPAPGVDPTLGIKRVLVRRFPYALVFLEMATALRVLAVAHQRQRPGYWRNRL